MYAARWPCIKKDAKSILKEYLIIKKFNMVAMMFT